MLGRLWSHRSLVVTLARAQYTVRFRQSFVGILWAVMPPLATLGVGMIVFHEVAGIDTGPAPYAVFVLAGLIPWTFFANGLMFGVPSVVTFPLLVGRVPFPRAVLPLSMIGVSLIDLGVTAGLFVVVAYVAGSGLPATAAWIPVLVLVEVVLVTGMILLGSALNVFARDVRLAVPIATQLMLFVTPVMYPLASVPEHLRALYRANPMTGLVESFRLALVGGGAPDIGLLGPTLLWAGGSLVVGAWYFSAVESRFADVI